jgi:hypothetical protein
VELIPAQPLQLVVSPAPPLNLKVPFSSAAAAELQRIHRRAMLRAATPAPAAPPVPAPAPDAIAIGSLSAGGDASPRMRQDAVNLLSQVDQRIGALPPSTARARESQIAQVREFERKSRLALGAGDAQGAWTLATKAKLLLDDLLK